MLSWKNTFILPLFYEIVRIFYVAHLSHRIRLIFELSFFFGKSCKIFEEAWCLSNFFIRGCLYQECFQSWTITEKWDWY